MGVYLYGFGLPIHIHNMHVTTICLRSNSRGLKSYYLKYIYTFTEANIKLLI